MAKPLSPKSRIIRAALAAHPEVGNTDLAGKLNDSADRLDDKLEFTAQDIAAQKQALKAPGAVKVEPAHVSVVEPAALPEPEPVAVHSPAKPAKKKPGRPKGSKKAVPAAAKVTKAPAPAPKHASHADVIDSVFDLADQVGGFDHLRRIVERLAR